MLTLNGLTNSLNRIALTTAIVAGLGLSKDAVKTAIGEESPTTQNAP